MPRIRRQAFPRLCTCIQGPTSSAPSRSGAGNRANLAGQPSANGSHEHHRTRTKLPRRGSAAARCVCHPHPARRRAPHHRLEEAAVLRTDRPAARAAAGTRGRLPPVARAAGRAHADRTQRSLAAPRRTLGLPQPHAHQRDADARPPGATRPTGRRTGAQEPAATGCVRAARQRPLQHGGQRRADWSHHPQAARRTRRSGANDSAKPSPASPPTCCATAAPCTCCRANAAAPIPGRACADCGGCARTSRSGRRRWKCGGCSPSGSAARAWTPVRRAPCSNKRRGSARANRRRGSGCLKRASSPGTWAPRPTHCAAAGKWPTCRAAAWCSPARACSKRARTKPPRSPCCSARNAAGRAKDACGLPRRRSLARRAAPARSACRFSGPSA